MITVAKEDVSTVLGTPTPKDKEGQFRGVGV